MSLHPLDAPILSSLKGRHKRFSIGVDGAYRYDPAYAVFGAVEDQSDKAMLGLAELALLGDVALMDADAPDRGPALALCSDNEGVQMVVERAVKAPEIDAEIVALGADDADDMLHLATMTEPGPFFLKTPMLGDFYGIRIDRQLVAMAGERMKPDGFTEVSGVCTHPDYRGKSYGGALTHRVATEIADRGETAFLHTYARNTAAIALYERLGFKHRRNVRMLRLTRA